MLSLFDAFSGLTALLTFAAAIGALLCLSDSPTDSPRGDFTLRRRQR